MTHNLISKIEIVYLKEKNEFHLLFNGKTLETQRKSIRGFRDLNQIGYFLQEIHEKNNISEEMQERDLLVHLNHDAIKSINIYESGGNYKVIFNVNDVMVTLLTQKLKDRVFKTINALLSFLKSFFGEKIYILEKIRFQNEVIEKEFLTDEKGRAYDKFILKLGDPSFII